MTCFKRIVALSLAVILSCICLAGCNSVKSGTDTAMRSVVDMTGNTIEIPEKVDKVFVDWASGITLVMT